MRGDRRINGVLAEARAFVSFAVVHRETPSWVLETLYELADRRDLPLEAQGEDGRFRQRLLAAQRPTTR